MLALDPDVVTIQKPMASLPVFSVLVGVSFFFPGELGNMNTILQCCTLSFSHAPYALASGFCLAMTWIYLYRTLDCATASYLTLMSMATPIIVSLLAIVFLNEKLAWIQVVGGGLIILSGVAIYFSDISYQ